MHTIPHRHLSLLLALGMILGSYRGYVALFETDQNEPRQILPYKISALPPEDQTALEYGIPVRNEKALEHLLEDYMS